jgi:CelD/BcsL family acetyltransferase involved in cellulose biosynthesis
LTNGFIINTKEQVEFYFDLEEDYPMNTTNNAITNNKRMKIKRNYQPEHLTDKEKANLMVAWARTHNKSTRRNNNITKRRVEKIGEGEQNRVIVIETS